MDMIAVTSSNIASVGYNPGKQILHVEFSNGSVYEYRVVPLRVYKEFMQAESHGKFFNARIKGMYSYTKISV